MTTIGDVLKALMVEIDRRVDLATGSPPLMTQDGLAAYLACSRPTVERMRSSGRLPKPDLHVGMGKGSSPRWRRETIDRWIEKGGRP